MPLTLTLPGLPVVFARLGARLPAPLLSLHLVILLELARHRRWLTPPDALNGRSFALTLTDLGLRHGFCCREGGFRPHRLEPVDLALSADLADFVRLLCGQTDADTLFFQRRLQIAGDTELGLQVKNWLDALERPAWLVELGERLADG